MAQKKIERFHEMICTWFLPLQKNPQCSALPKKMNVNVSTVSRRLDTLEEQWQTHIFDRTSKELEKTELAEQLLPFAEAAERAVNGFIQVIEGHEHFDKNSGGTNRTRKSKTRIYIARRGQYPLRRNGVDGRTSRPSERAKDRSHLELSQSF